MASIIRKTHRLLTLAVNLLPDRSGGTLHFTAFHGTEELGRLKVPAESAGVHPELTVRAYRHAKFQLPKVKVRRLVGPLLERAAPGEPLWLQVGPSGGHLGIVPWERLVQPLLGKPLLRVPNFLADPVFVAGRLRVALLVSSPRAKTPFSVEEHARRLVHMAQEVLPRGVEVDVFADLKAYAQLADHLPALGPQHVVRVHDPKLFAGHGQGGAAHGGPEGNLASPWLSWVRGALATRPVDAVHFVCPGYFRGDRGALAVARSPAENVDREWAHMVGATELMAFLDAVGAWAVAFSPPHDDVWGMGVRLLADRVAWQRPGALLVRDSRSASLRPLAVAYRFLFGEQEEPPPASPELTLYAHPKRMQRYREDLAGFEAASALGFRTGADQAVPEQVVSLAWKADRSCQAAAAPENRTWRRTAELQLDERLTRLGEEDSPARRGALDALERVRQILGSTGR